MRKECPDCIVYRSFPGFKGDCDPCILDLTDEDCIPPLPTLDQLQKFILDMNDDYFPGWDEAKDWDKNSEDTAKEYMYWSGALAGEAGEMANANKKYVRWTRGWSGKKLSWEEFQEEGGKELADMFIYIVLYSKILGIDLNEVIAQKVDELFKRFKISEEVPYLT